MQIASTCDGRLQSVPVQLFEEVKQGQTLAVINTVLDDEKLENAIKAEQQILFAEIEQLDADLNNTHRINEADVKNRRAEWTAEHRAFTSDIVTATLNILTIQTTLKPDRVLLESLKLNDKIYLMKDGAASSNTISYDLKKMRLEYDEVAKRVEANQTLLDQASAELDLAEDRRKEYYASYPELISSTEQVEDLMFKSINVIQKKIDKLWVSREPLVLKAPFDGIVSQLPGKVGEAVTAGTSILTLEEAKPSLVLAYVGGGPSNIVEEDMKVEMITNSDPPQIGATTVVTLGPAIEMVPDRLWHNPNVPQWGRPFLVRIPEGMKLISGELVGIRKL
jgi:multidrug resistance efflux pump